MDQEVQTLIHQIVQGDVPFVLDGRCLGSSRLKRQNSPDAIRESDRVTSCELEDAREVNVDQDGKKLGIRVAFPKHLD